MISINQTNNSFLNVCLKKKKNNKIRNVDQLNIANTVNTFEPMNLETLETNQDDVVMFNDIYIPRTETSATISDNKLKLSYTVQVNKVEYIIDFDEMKQINLMDIRRRRNIKKIIIPSEIMKTCVSNIIFYLKNTHKVLGISGTKF